ncbi:MAG: FAD-dependent monooxygenase [Acidobacteria bacterium]|nr:FAD-dependent monooxygenase [Acidobacteriota bacterium]
MLFVDDYARLPTANLQICNPGRPTTCVLMGEGRHRWEFMILPGETADEVSDDAFIDRLLEPWKVKGAVRIERKAVYTFRARIARQWRKGRVLLAGDAAHQTPPFAGQGMCSGLRDAANLAWKLAAVTSGSADDRLLDTYQPEREPNVRATIAMAIMMGRMVCTTSRWSALLRDMKFKLGRMLGKLPAGPPAYPPISEGLIAAGSAAAGSYFPQAVAANGARLDDCLSRDHWLLSRADLAQGKHRALRRPACRVV